jgi:single-stranded DNA-binding protein
VNNVSLIGTLVNEPELTINREGRDECLLQLEVPRRDPDGNPVPGVIYVDVTAFGVQAKRAAVLSPGQRFGVSGSLERDDSPGSRGPRRSRWEVHAHQIELFDAGSPPAAEWGGGDPAPPPRDGV